MMVHWTLLSLSPTNQAVTKICGLLHLHDEELHCISATVRTTRCVSTISCRRHLEGLFKCLIAANVHIFNF
ncbi:hypothetical protein BD410DRAFT_446629 [Rickenella mellea]|uniref:Uncharacterized protein n=1 Tax=Rickenella mellea TaxID=50990 RepID=A0A4Y7PVU0_9AGAM|nr:hypothetical protein BD410DRAFT_446629 [Rickenella mellea]